jgi:uncharacterized protein
MKKLILSICTLLFLCTIANAQDDTFTKDIMKLQATNGTQSTYDIVFDQLTMQLKTMHADINDSVWLEVKSEVFVPEVDELQKLMVPLYKKYYTHDDVKAIIQFYESPAGKKMAATVTDITMETMQVSQQWAMGAMQKIQNYLVDNGHSKPNPFHPAK